jgi:SAM-dependent methyltransferase
MLGGVDGSYHEKAATSRRTPNDVCGMPPSRPDDYDAARLDVIRARWDRKAERWDDDLADEGCHLNEDDAYSRFLLAGDETVAARHDYCRRHLLVDLGCGTGLVLAHFIDRFASGVGIDISEQMLVAARRRSLARAAFQEMNCLELSRHVSGAGAVFSRGVLLSHYGTRWARVLLQQVRESLLPDGGFALLDCLNAAARHRFACNPKNKTYYHAEELVVLAREAGFLRATILSEPERRVLLLLAER